ncbi:MAG TPA: helix-turn-helix domain-containing protein [Labilithrix sp.]|nr:helix-turn-helix domain-containing protein [Labilithrix sp.]
MPAQSARTQRISRDFRSKKAARATPRTAYRVLLSYDDDDGRWSARVKGLTGCKAEARTIPRVCARLRGALPRYAIPRTAPLSLVLQHPVGSRVRNLRVLRERTERAAREMHDETRKLTATLVAQGLTVRDIGELLGISYQRVQQIIKGE